MQHSYNILVTLLLPLCRVFADVILYSFYSICHFIAHFIQLNAGQSRWLPLDKHDCFVFCVKYCYFPDVFYPSYNVYSPNTLFLKFSRLVCIQSMHMCTMYKCAFRLGFQTKSVKIFQLKPAFIMSSSELLKFVFCLSKSY